MDFHADIWCKIAEFLAIQCVLETIDRKSNLRLSYLFKDLRRISKRCRSGTIAYQRILLDRWFLPRYTRSVDTANRRVYEYGKIMKLVISQVKYPNNILHQHRLHCSYNIKKYGIQDFQLSAHDDTLTYAPKMNSEREGRNLWSKLFPGVIEHTVSKEEPVCIFDRIFKRFRRATRYIDTLNEINIRYGFHCGKRHYPTVIHFPKRDVTYIFIYEHDKLVVSAKRKPQKYRFQVHQIPEDPVILSYARALQSSLSSILSTTL